MGPPLDNFISPILTRWRNKRPEVCPGTGRLCAGNATIPVPGTCVLVPRLTHHSLGIFSARELRSHSGSNHGQRRGASRHSHWAFGTGGSIACANPYGPRFTASCHTPLRGAGATFYLFDTGTLGGAIHVEQEPPRNLARHHYPHRRTLGQHLTGCHQHPRRESLVGPSPLGLGSCPRCDRLLLFRGCLRSSVVDSS